MLRPAGCWRGSDTRPVVTWRCTRPRVHRATWARCMADGERFGACQCPLWSGGVRTSSAAAYLGLASRQAGNPLHAGQRAERLTAPTQVMRVSKITAVQHAPCATCKHVQYACTGFRRWLPHSTSLLAAYWQSHAMHAVPRCATPSEHCSSHIAPTACVCPAHGSVRPRSRAHRHHGLQYMYRICRCRRSQLSAGD